MKRIRHGLIASAAQVAALGGLVYFAYTFGLRWGVLAGALALFVIGLALDGDL